jgi:flagellar hook assembly protein FlgD
VADDLYKRLIDDHESFWSCVYTAYMDREITRGTLREVVRKELGAGSHAYAWDGADDQGKPLPAGVYYAALRISAAPAVEVLTRKVVLIR